MARGIFFTSACRLTDPPLNLIGTAHLYLTDTLSSRSPLTPTLSINFPEVYSLLQPLIAHFSLSYSHHLKLVPWVSTGVGRTAMVQIDSISNAGTMLRNNIFTNTSCNLGRYKSSNSIIDGNTFINAVIPNLELTWLPQFFEGPVHLENVSVTNNRIKGEGAVPIHCGPWCEHPTCVGPPKFGPWKKENCLACPSCYSGDTPWTSGILLRNNTIMTSE